MTYTYKLIVDGILGIHYIIPEGNITVGWCEETNRVGFYGNINNISYSNWIYSGPTLATPTAKPTSEGFYCNQKCYTMNNFIPDKIKQSTTLIPNPANTIPGQTNFSWTFLNGDVMSYIAAIDELCLPPIYTLTYNNITSLSYDLAQFGIAILADDVTDGVRGINSYVGMAFIFAGIYDAVNK